MDLADSPLFKDFSRSVLQEINSSRELVPAAKRGIMNIIVQQLVTRSKLEVSRVEISETTADSYTISIECRVTGTGPFRSTVSQMEVDMVFNGSSMGQLRLPELVLTSFRGANMVVESQRVLITDMTAWKAFIRSVMVDDETCLRLENGSCSIEVMTLTAACEYNVDVPIRGMSGLGATVKKLQRKGDKVSMRLRIHNPSPVEVDCGKAIFALRAAGVAAPVAELRGRLKMTRGVFNYTVKGRLSGKLASATDKMRLSGVGVEGPSWCGDTIRDIDVAVDMRPQLPSKLCS